ncbi:MAG TPA: hypothetical protein VMQ65_06960 [Candidatus Limnocylindria bacterium]|nr:hypothetical protein [Candidatus Limnocylindria bacterium]
MSFHRRDVGEVEALITDRYLDSILAVQPAPLDGPLGDAGSSVGAAVRAISRRLSTDLPRFHPSFRFEERLALRLAEVAASIRLPIAAGAEGQSIAIRRIQPAAPDPLGVAGDGDLDDRLDGRPFLIGGAVAASALSLAGAWFAWRRRTSPMARAIRAVHSMRHTGA